MATPFARLLLATEHSDFDTGSEALALALARHCALPLAGVLPVLGNPEFEMVAPQLAAKADREASVKREHLLALAQAAGVQLTLRVRHGPEPFEEIVQEALAQRADLVVIRRRGTKVGHQYQLLGHALGGDVVVEPYLITLSEDAVPYTAFQHDGVEFIFMLSGEVEYGHADRSYRLKPGDAILFDSTAPQGPAKLIKTPMTYLSIIIYPRA